MITSAISTAIDGAIDGRHLLDHPYYQAWQEGNLCRADLGEYAGQYRHFECALPAVLSTVAAGLADSPARSFVEANLRDEESRPRPHIELFDDFAAAVGASDSEQASKGTAQLVALYRQAAERGPVPALAVIAAYETQAAAVAATKSASLAEHYRLDAAATEFWAVHAEVEESHASWTGEALADLRADPSKVEDWATRSAKAWWTFLDEREAVRAA